MESPRVCNKALTYWTVMMMVPVIVLLATLLGGLLPVSPVSGRPYKRTVLKMKMSS